MTDPLQELIHSLTPTEKRYFNLFATAFKSDTELLKLFQVLDELPNCTTAELDKKVGVKNLPMAKNNLKKLVLKAMRNFMEDDNPELQLRDTLTNMDFLMRKGLLDEARREIHKGLKLATKSENYNYSPRLMYRLIDIAGRTLKEDKHVGEFAEQLKALDEMMAAQRETYTSLFYNLHITDLMRNNSRSSFDDDKYFETVLKQIESRAAQQKKPYAMLVDLLNLAACYQSCGQRGKAVDTYEKVWKFFKKNGHLIDINPNGYFTFLNNYGIICAVDKELASTAVKLFGEMEAGFAKYSDFFHASPDRLGYYRERLTMNKLSYTKTQQKWPMLKSLEAEVNNHINGEGNKEKIVKALQAAMLISCFFDEGNYDKVLEWAKVYYTLDDAKVLKPMMLATRMLEAIAFYYKKQFDISANLCMNIYKTMAEQKLNGEYFKQVGTMLRKLNNWDTKAAGDRKEMEDLIKALVKLEKERNDDYVVYSTFFSPDQILESLLAKR